MTNTSDWISVETKLPKIIEFSAGEGYGESEHVLVFLKNARSGGLRVAVSQLWFVDAWNGKSRMFWGCEGGFGEVTHWMPLPRAPKEIRNETT